MKLFLTRLGDLILREPVLFFGGTGLAGAVLTLLITLGVLHLSAAVSGAITVIEDLIVLIIARSAVTPVASLPTAAGSFPESGIKPPAA